MLIQSRTKVLEKQLSAADLAELRDRAAHESKAKGLSYTTIYLALLERNVLADEYIAAKAAKAAPRVAAKPFTVNAATRPAAPAAQAVEKPAAKTPKLTGRALLAAQFDQKPKTTPRP